MGMESRCVGVCVCGSGVVFFVAEIGGGGSQFFLMQIFLDPLLPKKMPVSTLTRTPSCTGVRNSRASRSTVACDDQQKSLELATSSV